MIKTLEEFHKFVQDKIDKPKVAPAQVDSLKTVLNRAKVQNRAVLNRRRQQ